MNDSFENSSELTICITGAAGQLGQSFIPLLCTGQVFGDQVQLNIRLLDLPHAEKTLKGIVLEIQDGAYPLVKDIQFGSDAEVLFKDIDVGVFIGGFPRKQGMERKELLEINSKIFISQGQILNKVAKKDCRVVVVANPANTNCLILQKFCPSIPKENFTALTRLDQNRAKAILSQKSGVKITNIKNIIIWGNHSSKLYTDVYHGVINNSPVSKIINDEQYLDNEFLKQVQQRGAEIISVKGSSSVFSAANAVKDHLKDWYLGSDQVNSMGVITNENNPYNIPSGLCFSLPLKMKGKWEYEIVGNFELSPFQREKITDNIIELQEESQETSTL